MRTKTHGLENKVIRDGEFNWYWYKLIPTNAKVSVYTIVPVNYHIQSSGNLSSGQVYAALAGLNVDFSWDISGEITFSLNPDALPALTDRENISDDALLRTFEESLATRIGNFALQRINTYANSDDSKELESFALSAFLPGLYAEIEKAFPEIENVTCTLTVVRFPDYTLYLSIKALYQEYLAKQTAILGSDAFTEAGKRMETRVRIDELANYGEILTKYPILLQYLALEKGLLMAGDISPER